MSHPLSANAPEVVVGWESYVVKDGSAQERIGKLALAVARDDDYRPELGFVCLIQLRDLELHLIDLVEQVVREVPARLVDLVDQDTAPLV